MACWRGGATRSTPRLRRVCLQVVEPHLNGPGGEAADAVCDARGTPLSRDLRPGRGARGRDHRAIPRLGLDLVPGTGLLAAVVPRRFDAWMRLVRDYGTMTLAEVLAPAIGYAESGWPLPSDRSA